MNGVSIKIEGISNVQAFLKKASKEKLEAAQNAVKQAGLFMEGEVVESIAGHRAEPRSVDTGRFMNSISSIFPAPLTALIKTNVSYAKFLEYGTSKLLPRKHFRNSAERNRNKVKEFIKKKIEKL